MLCAAEIRGLRVDFAQSCIRQFVTDWLITA